MGRLAKGLDVRLGGAVVRVDHNDSGVVATVGNQELRGVRVPWQCLAVPGRECFDRDGFNWSSASRRLALE